MTSEASMRVVLRHALQLAAMKDDPQEAGSLLLRSVGGDRSLLLEAHAYYCGILDHTPDDVEARKAITLVEWALTGTGTGHGQVVVRGKRASTAG